MSKQACPCELLTDRRPRTLKLRFPRLKAPFSRARTVRSRPFALDRSTRGELARIRRDLRRARAGGSTDRAKSAANRPGRRGPGRLDSPRIPSNRERISPSLRPNRAPAPPFATQRARRMGVEARIVAATLFRVLTWLDARGVEAVDPFNSIAGGDSRYGKQALHRVFQSAVDLAVLIGKSFGQPQLPQRA